MAMNIQSVSNMMPITNNNDVNTIKKNDNNSFSNVLKDALNEVNTEQLQSDDMTNKLINGEQVDLHNVMIASEKAAVSLQTTLAIRNKVVEAYQEIMRMNM